MVRNTPKMLWLLAVLVAWGAISTVIFTKNINSENEKVEVEDADVDAMIRRGKRNSLQKSIMEDGIMNGDEIVRDSKSAIVDGGSPSDAVADVPLKLKIVRETRNRNTTTEGSESGRANEYVKGPLLYNNTDGWNGTSYDDGISFCKNKAGPQSYICPWKSYCPRGHLFEGISEHLIKNEEESWAPQGPPGGQPVWVSVGSIHPCIQSGIPNPLKQSPNATMRYIMCCRKGEEEQPENLPNLTMLNQIELWIDDEMCRSKCISGSNITEERSVIPPPSQRYCLTRCRWLYRQKALSRLTSFSKAQKYYEQSMTVVPPLMEGRCIDISDKLRYDGLCNSVAHRQKPSIELVLSSKSWLAKEMNLGLRDCPASRCDVSAGPGHSNSSHVYMGTFQKAAHPGQIEKVRADQINVMIQPESLKNTNEGKGMQPQNNIDWVASHRRDEFPITSWIPYSYINADDHYFRITGKSHGERRTAIPVFIRNCGTGSVHSNREHVIAELGKHADIEQFGKCDLAGATKTKLEDAYPECVNQSRRSAMWDAQKECVFFHSMFALVAENTFEENYLTEKIYQPLKMGTVPLIIGNSSLYRHHLPDPNAAIFLDDYSDYQEAARYISSLMKDPSLWQKHLEWKGKVFSDRFSTSAAHSFATLPCDLCDKYAEQVLPNSKHSWNHSLGLETLDTCVVDILSRHTIPDNLPVLNSAFGFDAVFVVHYTPLKERKEVMTKRVRQQLGVEPIFIEDFDREVLTDGDIKCFGNSEAQIAYIGRACKSGEVSLTMKHFAVYFYMVQKSLDNVLILEDDAAFMSSDWTSKESTWQKILRNLPTSYDLLLLSGFGNKHKKGEKVTDHLYLAQESRTAAMYLASQKGARNMLRSLPMVSVIDFQMNYAANWKGNKWMAQLPGFHGPRTVDIELYHTEPFMALQLEPDNTRNKTATWRNE